MICPPIVDARVSASWRWREANGERVWFRGHRPSKKVLYQKKNIKRALRGLPEHLHAEGTRLYTMRSLLLKAWKESKQ